MELKNIRTRDDFINYLEEHIPKDKLTSGTIAETADWFVAWVNAKLVFDSYTAKDLASAFLDGWTAIRENEKEHVDFFMTFFEETDMCIAEGEDPSEYETDAVDSLTNLLNEHFGLE